MYVFTSEYVDDVCVTVLLDFNDCMSILRHSLVIAVKFVLFVECLIIDTMAILMFIRII